MGEDKVNSFGNWDWCIRVDYIHTAFLSAWFLSTFRLKLAMVGHRIGLMI